MSPRLKLLCGRVVLGALAGSIAQGIHANMAAWEWGKLIALAAAAACHALDSILTDPKAPGDLPPPNSNS